ncbi:helix-turn-helix domain-containing protein [Streptomyces sp. NPDC052013]|uniref:helix-turn-helix domain-containing protein n=1 Tax=Streptomyces sp. NPDC052013 TaxID=3365679 RepID=UPI0037D2AA55
MAPALPPDTRLEVLAVGSLGRKPASPAYFRGDTRVKIAAQMRHEYEAGATILDLSRAYGRSTSSTYELLRQAGTQFRRRGKRSEPHP